MSFAQVSPSGPGTRRGYHHELRTTYRYLRLGIVVLGVTLFVGVGLQIIAAGGALLTSVSAYY